MFQTSDLIVPLQPEVYMCFNVSLTKDQKEVSLRFQIEFDPEMLGEPFYHKSAFSSHLLPVIIADPVKKVYPMEWGLIPHWVSDGAQAKSIRTKTGNARSETIFVKPSFKKAIIRQRGILPVDGFFEYHHIGTKKIPYYIKFTDHRLFSLAVIYNFWEAGGVVHRTFSVITTEANSLLCHIHNSKQRMPVIVKKSAEQMWLDPELSTDSIKSFFKPYPDAELTAYPVSRLLQTAAHNVPDIIKPAHYDELENEEKFLF